MAYEIVKNFNTEYAVDWQVIARLIRANALARYRSDLASVTTTSEASMFNPFSWSSPDIRIVEVDWEQVNARSTVELFMTLNQLRNVGDSNMPAVGRRMLDMVAETRRYNQRFLAWTGDVQSDNMARINAAVSSYDTQIGVAKFFRDTSADGLMVGATVLSGGAAAAVLAGGSTLKGVGRWEDSGSVSAGVLTGAGNLVLGVFKIGGMSGGALAVLQAGQESATCLIEGKSVAEAIATGSLKLAGPAIDKVVKLPFMKTMLEKAAVPLAVQLSNSTVAEKLVADMAKKLLQKQVLERSGKAVIGSVKSVFKETPAEAPPSTLDTATIGDDILVKFAIVNMTRGIGHGW